MLFLDVREPLGTATPSNSRISFIGMKYSEIRAAMRARNYHCTKAKRTRKAEDWEKYRLLRNRVTMMIRKSKLQHFEDVSERATKNPGKAWRELGKLLGTGMRGEIGAIQTETGTVVDKQCVADKFCKFFSQVIGVPNNDNDSIHSANEVCPMSNCKFRFHRIEEEDVLNLLKWVDTNKASGG